MSSFPHYRQQDQMDCGATCLKMICKYYGRKIGINSLRELCQVTKDGVNLLGISEAAEKIGFHTLGVKLALERLSEISLPCILHWGQNHFVVLYRIKNRHYYISDPARGRQILGEKDFVNNWFAHRELHNGISLLLNPTPHFFKANEGSTESRLTWSVVLHYFYPYRNLFIQLILGLLVGTILQLVAPFLTQSVVDIGINTRNLNFVHIILIAQLALFFGQTGVTFIRSWILLHVSSRINISVITDLLIKMMKLPMKFFEMKTTGDIMQRMADQKRIESFLTGSALSTLFSLINLLVFGLVLAFYHISIFFIFLGSVVLYAGWISLFLQRRRQLDHTRFAIASDDQTSIVELVSSIQEIKLNNAERQKRWFWEGIQAKLFHLKVKGLALSQYQESGSIAINQLKNILITYLSAKAVIDDDLTLGAMVAIQYIVGMVSSPIDQLLGFIQSYQDAKISLERINEVYTERDEEPVGTEWLREVPKDRSITFRNISFRYPGAGNDPVLSDINLVFPEGKTTAIVGMSGSGKTTLLKLILRYFEPEVGELRVGQVKLSQIGYSTWRNECGVVMQDGFIFADTIDRNIAVGDENPDKQRLEQAIRVANLYEFVEEQPFGLKTRIGTAGKGISQGQRQRLLIARAVYKNPHYILFDEATNALDANNEHAIINNLSRFLKGRTAIVVAHRLSTVSHADNIIVLDKGRVVEMGTHNELTNQRGSYYHLVKNQLELRG